MYFLSALTTFGQYMLPILLQTPSLYASLAENAS
jgi:hypothetical protein